MGVAPVGLLLPLAAWSPDGNLTEPFGVWNCFGMAAFSQICNARCP